MITTSQLNIALGQPVLEVAWSGTPSRSAYREAVEECREALSLNGAAHLLLDMRGLAINRANVLDKFFLGCLIVTRLEHARCAVLLLPEHITGVLSRVGAEAGAQLESFWRPETAPSWLLAGASSKERTRAEAPDL